MCLPRQFDDLVASSVLRNARRLVRLLIPRRSHPILDARLILSPKEQELGVTYAEMLRDFGVTDAFIEARFREGLRWTRVVDSAIALDDRVRVLDVGAGNGAIELALGATGRYVAISIEPLWNAMALALRRTVGVRRARASVHALPFGDGVFDVAICLETLEHLTEPQRAGREIARVLRPGGLLLITTPPRWRYALRRDPHFGIRGLVLLPARLQRWVAAMAGHRGPDEHVERIYSSVPQIARLFPSLSIAAVLSRSRAPHRWFWDAMLLRKQD